MHINVSIFGKSKLLNPGILAAIREVKEMGLGKDIKVLYEAHMKQIRDRNARDAYVYDEGVAAGEVKGLTVGRTETEERMQTLIARMTEAGEADKLFKLADKDFYAEMLRKYGL